MIQTNRDAIDDFEQARRQQETHNEVSIAWIIAIAFAFVSAMLTINQHVMRFISFSVSPVPAIVGLIVYTGVLFYLYRAAHYSAARKYSLTILQTLVVTVGLIVFAIRVPPTGIYIYIYQMLWNMLTIVLSGLRYSTRLVVFTGALACLMSLAFGISFWNNILFSAPFLTLISVSFSITTTIVIAIVVASLMRLHREAVWKERLSRFLAPELVQEMVRKPEILQQQTERRVATVLFTDIRGFTTLSEKLVPEAVVAFLNLFLREMTEVIMEHHGMVDKYVGDSVMGVFGVPVANELHAMLAVQAALDMQTRLTTLNRTLVDRNLPQLSIGIGIHTGELVVGAIGAPHRLDYTVIGDTVNVAARIEGLTRRYGVSILVSDTTRAMLPEHIAVREVGTTEVRNRVQPVILWMPIGAQVFTSQDN